MWCALCSEMFTASLLMSGANMACSFWNSIYCTRFVPFSPLVGGQKIRHPRHHSRNCIKSFDPRVSTPGNIAVGAQAKCEVTWALKPSLAQHLKNGGPEGEAKAVSEKGTSVDDALLTKRSFFPPSRYQPRNTRTMNTSKQPSRAGPR